MQAGAESNRICFFVFFLKCVIMGNQWIWLKKTNRSNEKSKLIKLGLNKKNILRWFYD